MIIEKLLEQDIRLDRIEYQASKIGSLEEMMHGILEGQDDMLGILKKMEVKITSLRHAIDRHERLLSL